jgi:hypothetical protein
MLRRLGCVLVLAVAMSGCSGSPTTSPPAPHATTGTDGILRTAGCTATPTSTPTADPGNDVPSHVESYATQHFPDAYAGQELRADTNRLRVYRVPSVPFDTWLTGTFANTCVEVVDAKHSAKELNALADRIGNDLAYWKSVHIPVWTVAPLTDGSAVQVGTSDVDGATKQMPLRYGADAPIVVVYAQQATAVSIQDAGKTQNRAS